jgi:hypothetical protein
MVFDRFAVEDLYARNSRCECSNSAHDAGGSNWFGGIEASIIIDGVRASRRAILRSSTSLSVLALSPTAARAPVART